MILWLAVSAASGLFSTTVNSVDSGPGSALRFFLWNAAILVAFLYVLGLPLFLVRVFRFVAAWHRFSLK
jgi:hypothetical protein